MPETNYAKPIRILQYCARCTPTMGEDLVAQNWYLQNNTSLVFDFAILFTAQLNESFRERVLADGNLFLTGTNQERNFLNHFSFYIKLFRQIRKQRYDAVCVHESTPLFLVPCWLAKLARIKKIIVVSHSTTAQATPWWIKLFHAFVFRFITNIRLAVSQKAGRALYGPRLPFQIIYNGIDTQKFAYHIQTRAQMREKLSLGTHPTFGFIGRLESEKNVLFLIDIFAALHQQNNEARFVIVGAGRLEDKMLAKIKQQNLQEVVQILIPPQKTDLVYQALDAFILPSLYEGFPLVLLEAQTSGLACFISDAVPPEENLCNTTVLSLAMPASEWAKLILEKMQFFCRKDESDFIRQAGFDIQTQIKTLEKICTQQQIL